MRRGKLLKKNLDMIAANEVGDAKVFDCEDNHLVVLWRGGRRDLGQAQQGLAGARAHQGDRRSSSRSATAPKHRGTARA